MAINKTQLMARAWAMHRDTRANMGACMKRAWELVRLADALRRPGVVHIVYRKKDGSIRRALATLNVGTGAFVDSAFRRPDSPKVFTYYDLERCGWRSFQCKGLMSWYK